MSVTIIKSWNSLNHLNELWSSLEEHGLQIQSILSHAHVVLGSLEKNIQHFSIHNVKKCI